MSKDSDRFFQGQELYGNSMTPEEISAWYETEREGYAELGASNTDKYTYSYHALNKACLFKHLPSKKFGKVLGFGSAYCDEFKPIINDIGSATIIEPSEAFSPIRVKGVPITYIKPKPGGVIDCPSNSFSLVLCLSALHHVPNVSTVINEFGRVLEPGGYALFREPIVTMGDWRNPRAGLTKNERGIPLHLFRSMIEQAGLLIKQETLCVFPLTSRLGRLTGKPTYNSSLAVSFDLMLSRLFSFHRTYHPITIWEKLQPAAATFVAQNPL